MYRFDLAGGGVVGRGGPADHLCRQGGVGLDDIGQVLDIGLRVDPQLDDTLGGIRQRRKIQCVLQPLTDAQLGEVGHRCGDLLQILGVVQVGLVQLGLIDGDIADPGLVDHLAELCCTQADDLFAVAAVQL